MKSLPPIARIALGLLFMVSGFIKLTQPYQNFLAVIHSYEVMSGWPAKAAALTLPWFEFLLGAFLVTGLWMKATLLSLWLMNTVFIALLASALARHLPLQECGCFGEAFSLPPQWMLLLDVGFWISFAFLMRFERAASRFSLDNHFCKK